MAIGREQRRQARKSRIAELFANREVEAALDLLDLTDMAWHDCYGPRELEIPSAVLDDILLLTNSDLALLIRLSRDAVRDFRDVRVAADAKRAKTHNRGGPSGQVQGTSGSR